MIQWTRGTIKYLILPFLTLGYLYEEIKKKVYALLLAFRTQYLMSGNLGASN